MPDPISLPNASIAGNYDPEANACVAASPSPLPGAPRTSATDAAQPTAFGAGAQQLIDGYAQGAHGNSLTANCEIQTLKAVATCGQFVATALASTPTVVGAVVAGLVGGMACGLASAEAYDCYANRPD
jgi:hypothetical protein